MARHLTQITNPLKQFLSARFTKQWRLDKNINLADAAKLPAPLFVAQMRGEAHLKTAFFTALEQKQITDPISQQYAWQQLITKGNCLKEIMENSGAAAFFHLNTQTDYIQQCYNAYCIILWDTAINQSPLENTLTTGLVNHYLPTLYPSKAKSKTPEQLKKEIAKLLTQQWQLKPEIKESFETKEDEVIFSLKAKLARYNTSTLITIKGKRLNNTRLKAYKQCLLQLESEQTPLPKALTPLKKEQTAPLK